MSCYFHVHWPTGPIMLRSPFFPTQNQIEMTQLFHLVKFTDENSGELSRNRILKGSTISGQLNPKCVERFETYLYWV